MILAEYTVICDDCGRRGPSSDRNREDAHLRSQAEGWTSVADKGRTEPVLALVVCPSTVRHWCPSCTEARKEAR